MTKIKHLLEYTIFFAVILFIIAHGILREDNLAAIISAVCGISYTFIAGKGYPICYIFGLTGSGFYSYLALNNALWGNLILYAGYYVPMQILGFFKWNKNLKKGKSDIVKISLSKKELQHIVILSLSLTMLLTSVLFYFKDAHPFLDSITTVCSLTGMYLTVRRAVEQWLFWMVVNALSLVMWLSVAIGGVRVWSTVLMWGVYLFLAVYFYFDWKKDMSKSGL